MGINKDILKAIDSTNDELYAKRNYSSISTSELIAKSIENNTLAQSVEYYDGLAEGLRILGILYCYEGDAEKALHAIRKAEQLCLNFSVDQRILAKIYNAYMYLYTEVLKDFNLSAQYSKKGLELAKELNMPHLIAKITINYGVVCNNAGMYDEALDSLLTSLKYGELANDKYIVMYSYENLGEVYYHLQDYDNSEKYFELALKEEASLEDQIIKAESKKGLGLIKYEKGERRTALEILEEVREYVKENQLRQLEINISLDLFNFYLENDMYEKIPSIAARLESIINDFESNVFYSNYYNYMRKYYKELGKYKKAYESLEKHNCYLKAVHNNRELQEITNVKSESMQKQLEQLQLLSEIGKDINTMSSIENILDAIYDYLGRFFEDYSLLLGILDEDKINYVYNKNRGERMNPYSRKLENNNSLATWSIKNEKMVVINDLENEFSMYVEKLVVYFDPDVPQSVIVIPLKVKDQIIGIINFQTMKKDMLTIERVEMFRIISSYAAIAVKNSLHSKELERLSNKDQLTGLYNWRYYDSKMEEFLSKDLKTFSLFILDIDHFKDINDKFGHSIGNLCLKKLAKITERVLSDSEFVARIGGEEFAVIYINKSRQEIVNIASSFVKIIEKEMTKVEDYEVNMTVSLGVAFYSDVINLIPDKIFKVVDKALYIAKDSGRYNAKYIFN